MKYLVRILCILILTTGCASKRYTRKASKFEDAGLYKDAAACYYEAVKRKDSNVDAKLGLHKTGQMTLDEKLGKFLDYYKQSNYNGAVYSFLDAEVYYEKIKAVGVDLSFHEAYRIYFQEAKSDYLGKRYMEANELLNRDDFSGALIIYSEIKDVDENYKDVKDKYITAKFEPRYREAVIQIEDGYYRRAYYSFDHILNSTGEYKQSRAFKEEAREKATIGILLSNFTYSNSQYRNAANTLTSATRNKIAELDNPFLKLIDPETLEIKIYKTNGKLDVKAANLAGIDAVVNAQLTEYTSTKGKLKKTRKKGFRREVVVSRNDEGEEIKSNKYHKVEYYEYEVTNTSRLKLNYTLISTKNSELLITESFTRSKSDKVHYAVYKGNNNELVPGYWKYSHISSKEDVIEDNKWDVRVLKRLLDARRNLISTDKLFNDLSKQAVISVANEIDDFNPEEE